MNDGIKARIVGLGLNMPRNIRTNADLEKIVDTTDEWITTRTGIRERRIADDGVTAWELGAPAAVEALEKAGIKAPELDMIICATATPDMMFPSTACLIQKEIGAKECAAFDILAACSGFIYALTIAKTFIATQSAKNILIVSTEVLSRIVDWQDRSTCVLFGDGAAATVISAQVGENGVIDSRIKANGEYADFLTAGPGSVTPRTLNESTVNTRGIQMKGNQTFKVAVNTMSEAASELMAANGLTIDDIDLVVPHQANIRIINAVGKSLGIPEEKVFINVQKYGNTSAATIPIALYEATEEGRIKAGDLILLVAFGGGFTWGATLIRW